ncbi:MAG TPA: SMC-Scp complex subunit ScpB, partial [Pirellulales bacterium]
MARKRKGDGSPPASAPSDAGEADLSLDRLTAAFAEIMGSAAPDPVAPAQPEATIEGESDDESAGEEPHDAEPMWANEAEPLAPAGEVTVQGIVEAMLFVGHPQNRPLPSSVIASYIRDVTPEEVDRHVAELNEIYASSGAPFSIVSEKAGWRMALREEYSGTRAKFYGRLKEAKLSQAAIEVLALVAYKPALTAEDVGTLRGTPSLAILSQLVRRQLLRVERHPTTRVAQYFTT